MVWYSFVFCWIGSAVLGGAVVYAWQIWREQAHCRIIIENSETEDEMTVNKFARKVTLREGKKVSISIAQVLEVLKIVNELLSGKLYPLIKGK